MAVFIITHIQVPLGILPKNEAKGDEMVDILKHVHDLYVPSIEYTEETNISTGETVTIQKAKLHPIIFGGDQLTAAKMRSAQKARLNSETPADKLSGLIPVAEDWHSKANFLGVSFIQ